MTTKSDDNNKNFYMAKHIHHNKEELIIIRELNSEKIFSTYVTDQGQTSLM